MKRNVIALICAAVVAVALLVPAGLQGLFAPKVPAGVTPAQTTSPQDRSGVPDGTASATSAAGSGEAASEPTGGTPPDQPEYVPGEILVGLADGVTVDQLNARLADMDYVATKSVSEDDVTLGYVQLQLADGVTVEDANARITSEPLIEAAQPNYVYYLQDETPEDANYSAASLQAGDDAEGVLTPQSTVINDEYADRQWALNAVRAYEAWDCIRAGNNDANGNAVTVAIIDSGVNTNHPDFDKTRIVGARSYINTPSYESTSYSSDVTDTYGHGTHVAGIIAAKANNNKGVAGVSYNAQIMPIKVIDGTGNTDTWKVARALDYVVEKRDDFNIKVVNISIGTLDNRDGMGDPLLSQDIQNAHRFGLLLVYAAGNGVVSHNDGHPYKSIPCDFDTSPGAIGVINVERQESNGVITYSRSASSNYNIPEHRTKDLSAPGGSILSTAIAGMSTSQIQYLKVNGVANTDYGYMSGTSMAAPYVSGVAALVFAANPSLSAANVKDILEDTALDLNTPTPQTEKEDKWDDETGYGMIDAAAAVQKALTYQGDHKVDPAPTIGGSSLVGVGGTAAASITNPGSRTWTWTSSNPAVATVAGGEGNHATANVTGVATGTVTITATSSDNIVLSYEVRVISATIAGQAHLDKDATGELNIECSEYNSVDQWNWTCSPSDNINLAVDATNNKVTVSSSQAGQFKITATLKSNSAVFAEFTLNVAVDDIKNATVAEIPRQAYTGNPIQPELVVKYGDNTLSKGTDYTVTYANNTNLTTESAKATATITGTGNYAGTKTVEFEIYSPFESAVVTVMDTGMVYTGQEVEPSVAVKIPAESSSTGVEITLTKDTDYTVSYSNNVNVTNEAVVTVTGAGGYAGTRTATFAIQPVSIESAQVTVENATYNGAARTPAPTVAMPAGNPWNGRVLAKGVDYDLSYADNVEVSKDGTKAKVTVTGKGNFTGSVTREFSILQAPLTKLVLSPSNYLYNGTQCTPLAVVYGPKDGKDNQPLTAGTDYVLTTPDGRTEPGTYPYSATGQGNYTGTVNASLTISKGTISSVNLSKSTYVYDGTQKSPSVTVIGSDGRVLTPNVDYTLVTPAERKDPGEYTYIAKPMGNYVGSDKTATLTISKASLSSATISMPVTSLSYTGSALRPAVIVKLGGKTLANGIDYTVSYSNNVNIGTSLVTITGKGNYSGTRMTTFKIIPSDADAYKGHSVQYRTHVQNVGWQSYVRDGAMSGTSGRALRLEGINISLANHPYSGSIRYRTHVQNIGWQGWRYDGAMSGTSGQSLRLEAIRIELTGQMAEHYDVYYRVHAQNVGWMAWAKNGESAGTAGYAYRLEGIQIVLRPKGSSAPTPSPRNAYNAAFKANQIQYRTHVQDDGWQSYVSDGATAGTSGRGLRLEGINIKLGSESGISGGVEYRTHVQNIGWQGWKSNGAMSGTSGQSLRLEAIQIRLTGNAAKQYDIYYRVHSQNIGWMGWAKNGAPAGTAGYAYRLEAIQIKLVPKGGLAPGTTAYAYRQR